MSPQVNVFTGSPFLELLVGAAAVLFFLPPSLLLIGIAVTGGRHDG